MEKQALRNKIMRLDVLIDAVEAIEGWIMKKVGKAKMGMKIPIAVDKDTKKLLEIGNISLIYRTEESCADIDEIDNAVFYDEIKYDKIIYTGYSNQVAFKNRDGITFWMRNRAALSILQMLCFDEIKLTPDGFVKLTFSFTKSGNKYMISPRKL